MLRILTFEPLPHREIQPAHPRTDEATIHPILHEIMDLLLGAFSLDCLLSDLQQRRFDDFVRPGVH